MTEPEPVAPGAYERLRDSREVAAWNHLDALPGYTPQIGALVGMMAYARLITLEAAHGLSMEQLGARPPGFSNSIGMLLAHVAATDRMYHLASFQGVNPLRTDVFTPHLGAMTFGKQGERVQGRTLETLTAELEAGRAATLEQLRQRDDAWLGTLLEGWDDFKPDQHWVWFHVTEHEASHRGQIWVIRRALPASGTPPA